MDFEERINRLAERHEALTQSMEMHQAQMRLQDERIYKLVIGATAQRELLDSVLTPMQDLIGIVAGHEQRIQNLEGRG